MSNPSKSVHFSFIKGCKLSVGIGDSSQFSYLHKSLVPPPLFSTPKFLLKCFPIVQIFNGFKNFFPLSFFLTSLSWPQQGTCNWIFSHRWSPNNLKSTKYFPDTEKIVFGNIWNIFVIAAKYSKKDFNSWNIAVAGFKSANRKISSF